MRLNPAQEAAVRHRGAPLLVLAGAGTGKTRVITHRVAALLAEGVPAWRILAVTFTNKAAAEMRARIAGLCEGRDDLRELWVGTFHAICARILRRWGEPVGLSRNFTILDASDQLSAMKRILKEQNVDPRLFPPQMVLGHLDKAKNAGHGAAGIARRLGLDEPLGSVVEAAAVAYERLLRASDAADFGDLLVLTVRLLEGARVEPLRAPRALQTPQGPLRAAPPRPPAPRLAAAPEPLHGPLAAALGDLAGELGLARPAAAADRQLSLLGDLDPGPAAPAAAPAASAPSEPPPTEWPEEHGLLDMAYTALRDRLGGAALADPEVDPVARLRRRFTHIVVDEYQDTNPVQAALVDLLGGRAELCVVGDDDQSIYGWRGADVDQILRFPERHPGAQVIRLEQNYRSTGHILGCANAIIRRNVGRFGKQLFSDLGDGDPVAVVPTRDEADEARFVALGVQRDLDLGVPPAEIAVFYRTHAQSRVLEDALTRAGIRYAIYGGLRFFDRKEIKDLLAYLRVLINPASDVDLQRIINVPARRIGQTTVERLAAYATERGLSLHDALGEAPAAGLGPDPCRKIALFRDLLVDLRGRMEDRPLHEVASDVLDATGYRDALAADASDEARDRLENLQEFVGALQTFGEENPDATLADYLEQVALVSGADGDDDDERRAIALMTIHSAKGLEFHSVYLTGMEERVFPHARVFEDPQQMEEERRLAYVAVTRARRRLTVTWAHERRLYGQLQHGEPSRFVRELPRQHLLATSEPSPPPSAPRAARPAREPEWDSDIVYDDDAAPRPSRARAPAAEGDVALYVGMRIRHPRYGEGELLGWDDGAQGLKLSLRFPGVGTKTILARYCEPA